MQFAKKSNIKYGNPPNLNSSLIYSISANKKWVSNKSHRLKSSVLVVYTDINTYRSAFRRVIADTLNMGLIRSPIIFQNKKISFCQDSTIKSTVRTMQYTKKILRKTYMLLLEDLQ